MEEIIVSDSGGRTSAYLLRLILDNYAGANIRVVFANTGMERPETLEFIHQCSTRWGIHISYLEAVVNPIKGIATTYRKVDYETAYRPEYCWNPEYGKAQGYANPFYSERYAALHAKRPAEWGHPFEAVIAKYGIPNNSFPHCSRELKTQVIGAWIKAEYKDTPFRMALGIRADEAQREGAWWYPMIDWGITKADVRRFWGEQPFDLQLKDYEGNCDLCWKKGHNKNWTLLEEYPILGLWWAEMERKYGAVTPNDAARRQTKKQREAVSPLFGDLRANASNKKKGPFFFNHNAISLPAMQAMADRGRFARAKDQDASQVCACNVEFESLAQDLQISAGPSCS